MDNEDAIEKLKILCDEVLKQDNCDRYDNYSPYEKMAMVDTVLAYIEELEKENEEIKEDSCCLTTCLRKDKEKLFLKQKVRDKIEELKREFDFYAGREHSEWEDGEFDGEVCDDIALKIGVLKELLEEE